MTPVKPFYVRPRQVPEFGYAPPESLVTALAGYAAGAAAGRFDPRAERLLATLLRRHGPTVHGGRLFFADGAGEVRADPHTSGGFERAKPKAAFYDPETGTWA